MAPRIPQKRPSIRTKSKSKLPTNTPRTRVQSTTFPTTKRDKRTIRYSSFLSRIEKANHSKTHKRRRPSRKLVTTLTSLADALPGLEELRERGNGEASGKIKQKSVRTRPGAMRRREKAERAERERFERNAAALVAGVKAETGMGDVGDGRMVIDVDEVGGTKTSISSRWAALRGFISQTLEQKEEFKKG